MQRHEDTNSYNIMQPGLDCEEKMHKIALENPKSNNYYR